MASRPTQLATGIALLIAVSFAVHYALFGALPVGTPALLEDDAE
jgi:hypothetical protein